MGNQPKYSSVFIKICITIKNTVVPIMQDFIRALSAIFFFSLLYVIRYCFFSSSVLILTGYTGSTFANLSFVLINAMFGYTEPNTWPKNQNLA